MIAALITSKKKPSVKTVIGRVNKISNGLINMFKIDRTTANTIAVITLSTETPGKKCVTNKIANVEVNTLARKLIKL